MPTLSTETLSTIAVAGVAATALALAGVVALAIALAKVRRSHARLLSGGSGREDIVAAFDRHLAAVERLARTTDGLGREVAELRQRSSTLLHPGPDGRPDPLRRLRRRRRAPVVLGRVPRRSG